MTITLSPEEIDKAISYRDLIGAIADAFRGDFEVPLRHHHTVMRPGGVNATLLLIPTWTNSQTPLAGHGL